VKYKNLLFFKFIDPNTDPGVRSARLPLMVCERGCVGHGAVVMMIDVLRPLLCTW